MPVDTEDFSWVFSIPANEISQLKMLYSVPGLQVLTQDGLVWVAVKSNRRKGVDRLEGDKSNFPERDIDLGDLPEIIRGIYGAQIYSLHSGSRLIPFGKSVPTTSLPSGQWHDIQDWIELRLPRSACSPGKRAVTQVQLTTQRLRLEDFQNQTPNLLWTSIENWTHYGVEAAQFRLDPLQFAFDPELGILIRGLPLPPIEGRYFSESDLVAIEFGWHWHPRVSTQTLRQTLDLNDTTLLLLESNGTFHEISMQQFVNARRESIRATAGDYHSLRNSSENPE
ncbi:MAG: hypothetical protein AAF939_06695 [Planctomycetota bacterium]